MTYLDPGAELEFQPADEHVTVRIALSGPVSGEWRARYRELALASEVPAYAETGPDQAWIVVRLPDGGGQQEVLAVLDAAFALMAEAEAAEWPVAPARTEATVRAWWAGKVGSETRTQAGAAARSSGLGSEVWWPLAMALAVALAVPVLLAASVRARPAMGWCPQSRHCCCSLSSWRTGVTDIPG